MFRALCNFVFLALATAALTYGAVAWHYLGFSLQGAWLVDNGFRPHPVHWIAAGAACVPMALWRIFLAEAQRAAKRKDAAVPP